MVSSMLPAGGAQNQVPDEAGGIQVNCCCNTACVNFGQAPLAPIKNNRAIVEEIDRMAAYLRVGGPSCQNSRCSNHDLPVALHPGLYRKHGQTRSGNVRHRCKGCGKTVSTSSGTCRPRRKNPDAEVFALMAKKVALRRALRIMSERRTKDEKVNARTLYRKIDLIHRKCLAFGADREWRLPVIIDLDLDFRAHPR